MFKKLILALLNKVFGLNITEGQLNAFIDFIKMLIEVFGSVRLAVEYVVKTTRQARAQTKEKARAAFLGVEKVLVDG